MTTGNLKRLCTLWQKRLRLQDWKVAISFGDVEEGNCGLTSYYPDEMRADVVIATDVNQYGYADGGIEATLVHELLHIVIHGHKTQGRSVQMERAINMIADALLDGYRRKRGRH